MGSLTHEITATIASGESLSGAVCIGAEHSLVGIEYPAAWDAAGVTFQASHDGVHWHEHLDDAGTAISQTVTAGEHRELDAADFKTAIFLKVRSGTAALPVVQTAARKIKLYTRRYIGR